MEGVEVYHSAVGGGGGTLQVREGTIQYINFFVFFIALQDRSTLYQHSVGGWAVSYGTLRGWIM